MKNDPRKEKIKDLVRDGKRDEAIDYIRSAFGFSDTQAERLVNAASRQIEKEQREKQERLEKAPPIEQLPAAASAGCSGCMGLFLKGIGLFFFMTAIILLLGVGIMYLIVYLERDELVTVEAVIVELSTTEGHEAYPVVEYSWEGEEYRSDIWPAVEPDKYTLNQQVTVYIHPNNPDMAYFEEGLTMNFYDTLQDGAGADDNAGGMQALDLIRGGLLLTLGIPALFCIVIGIVLWRIGNRWNKKAMA